MSAVTVSTKGQIVLPQQVRSQLGIRQGDRLEVLLREGEILLRPLRGSTEAATDWRRWEGILAGTSALDDHLREHRAELERERLP